MFGVNCMRNGRATATTVEPYTVPIKQKIVSWSKKSQSMKSNKSDKNWINLNSYAISIQMSHDQLISIIRYIGGKLNVRMSVNKFLCILM